VDMPTAHVVSGGRGEARADVGSFVSSTFLQRHLQPGLSTGVFLRVGLIAARLALLRREQGTMIGGVIIMHKLLAVAMLGAHLQTHLISPAKQR
jgi:hypothetical protein